MLAWLTVAGMLAEEPGVAGLGERIALRRQQVFSARELNVVLEDVDAAFVALENYFEPKALECDRFDGLSFVMPGDWRFSVRRSKTEPVVRINFEARLSADTMLSEGINVLRVLEPYRGDEVDWLAGFRLQ